MVHSFCQVPFLPMPASADVTLRWLLAVALSAALLPARAADSVPPIGKAAEGAIPAAPLTSLRVDNLILNEKKAREQQSRQRQLPTLPSTGAVGTGVIKPLSSVPAHPVLWSLSGTRADYVAEVFWGKQLITISSDQSQIPQLGVLEYMDETGVYIRPGRKHRLPKSWLDSEGLLVLPAPREGQAAPILVDIPKFGSQGAAMGLGSASLYPASQLPVVVPQSVPQIVLAPTSTLGSAASTLGSPDGNSPRKTTLITSVNPAMASGGKDTAVAQDKKK